jgi:general secretion pathway protein G
LAEGPETPRIGSSEGAQAIPPQPSRLQIVFNFVLHQELQKFFLKCLHPMMLPLLPDRIGDLIHLGPAHGLTGKKDLDYHHRLAKSKDGGTKPLYPQSIPTCMNFTIKLLAAATFVTLPLLSQEKEKEADKTAPHPAAVTIITWADAHKAGKIGPKQQIFRPMDLLALTKISASGDDFRQKLREIILKEKASLSFKADNDQNISGFLMLQGKKRLPMIKVGDRWVLDLLKTFEEMKSSAQENTALADINALGSAIEMYRNIGRHYPSEDQGLASLVKKPTTAPRPRRWVQTLRSLDALKDPWGNPYQYKLVDGNPNITSLGPDGKVSDDDLSTRGMPTEPSPKRKGGN